MQINIPSHPNNLSHPFQHPSLSKPFSSKFNTPSFSKLKIKAKSINHLHKPTNTHSLFTSESKTSPLHYKLPPLIHNTSSHLNCRSRTPLGITTQSNINIFTKNEIQLISSLKNELMFKNEENQRLMNKIKSMRHNMKINCNCDSEGNKELEQRNMLLNEEIKKMQCLLQMKENGMEKEEGCIDEYKKEVDELNVKMEEMRKKLDKQILQNKKLKEVNVMLNSNKVNMLKLQGELYNKIHELEKVIDDKDKYISELNIMIEQYKYKQISQSNTSRSILHNNIEYTNVINFTIESLIPIKEDKSPLQYNIIQSSIVSFSYIPSIITSPKQFTSLSQCNLSTIHEFTPDLTTTTKTPSLEWNPSLKIKTPFAFSIPHPHSDSCQNSTSSFDNIPLNPSSPKSETNDEVLIKSKNTFALLQHKPRRNIAHSQISISFKPKPKTLNKVSTNQISFFIYSNKTDHSDQNSLTDPFDIQLPCSYPNFISETEIETTLYLLLKTIQSKNLLPAMLCDEILQLVPFTIESVSTFFINTLHLDKESFFILNRLIYGMGYKENTFSYELFKSHMKVVFNDNLSNIPFDKKVNVSNEVDRNALTDVISLCVKYDMNYVGVISFEVFSNIVLQYMKRNYITQKGYEYLIYSMKRNNECSNKKNGKENENIMMLYYKSLTALIPKLKEREGGLRNTDYEMEETKGRIIKEGKKDNVDMNEQAKGFVDDVFEWALMEKEIGDGNKNNLLSSYRNGNNANIENMFKEDNHKEGGNKKVINNV